MRPGVWFQSKMKQWKEDRKRLQRGHLDFNEPRKKEGGKLRETSDAIDLASVVDIHNADDHGTPLYANFRYEDWLLLSWRYELHLLVHAFAADVADDDIPGIPENHLGHYFSVYFGICFSPEAKLGVPDVSSVVKLLRDPIEFVEHDGGPRTLRSGLDKEASLDVFVKSVEAYRRDRKRRLEAGDESAQLSVPSPSQAKVAPKGMPTKAAPGKKLPGAASPLAKIPPAKAAPAKAHPGGKVAAVVGQGITTAASATFRKPGIIAKAPLSKTAPRPAPVGLAAPYGGALPPAKAAPTGGVKRPTPPGAVPPLGASREASGGPPPLKRPRHPASLPPPSVAKAKAPIAKRKPAPV